VDLERAELLSMAEGAFDLDRALALCDDALACIEQIDDEFARAAAQMSRAFVLCRGDRFREATAAAEKARVVFAAHDNTHSLANVCRFMAEVHLACGRVPEASLLSAEAIEGYRRTQDSVSEAYTLRIRARTWKARGKVAKALADCDDSVRLYDRARMRTAQGKALLLRADFHAEGGVYDEAQLDLDAAVRYLRRSPEAGLRAFALLRLADVLRRRNDLDGAAQRLDQAEEVLALVPREAVRARLFLEVCRIGKELPTPDKPRIRRCSALALAIARALGDEEVEAAATSYASFAG
jgi:tetratricopeptide (TPR) repeat protein